MTGCSLYERAIPLESLKAVLLLRVVGEMLLRKTTSHKDMMHVSLILIFKAWRFADKKRVENTDVYLLMLWNVRRAKSVDSIYVTELSTVTATLKGFCLTAIILY